jgi:hypothetical protein
MTSLLAGDRIQMENDKYERAKCNSFPGRALGRTIRSKTEKKNYR